MSTKAIFLCGLVKLCACFTVCGQSEAELAQFQSFFDEENEFPLEKTLQAASLKLDQAREIADPREESMALKNLGLLHLNRLHDYEKAMVFFIRALAIEDSIQWESQQVLSYVAIARVFNIVGDYYKSAQFLRQALKINEAGKDINSLAMILIDLGNVNASMGHIEEAFSNYERVLRYKNDIAKKFEAEALFHFAHLYTLQGNYQEALGNHKKSLAIVRRLSDRYSEAQSLNDIGMLYALMGNDEKSLANHLVALEIRQALNDKRGMAESHNNIGSFYFKQKDPEKAVASGMLALEKGLESQAQDQIFRSYELLSQCYKDLADYKNALAYMELSLAIHEFIQNEKQERHLQETQNRYVLGKMENEIEKLDALHLAREKEIAAQKQFRNILFLGVVLVAVIALLVLYLYLVKRRSNRRLEVAKTEVQQQNITLQELNHTKDKFFSIISHDLKGPLSSLTSFSHLLIDHLDSMSKEEIQLLAKDLDKSVRNLFALLENLLEWSRSQTGNIDFTPEVFDLTAVLENNKNLLEGQAKSKKISLHVDRLSTCLVKLHKQSINTVVRNLISNAIKFTPEGGAIQVGVRNTNQRISISVKDNGVGIPPEAMSKLFRIDRKHSTKGTASEKGTGLGLILCKDFVEKNGGKISVQSEPGKGSVFSFSFSHDILVSPPIKLVESAPFS